MNKSNTRNFILLLPLLFALSFLYACKSEPIPVEAKSPPSIPKQIVTQYGNAIVLIKAYDQENESIKYGSGFFVNQNGLIATNFHIIEGAYKVSIHIADGTSVEASKIVGLNKDKDIVLIETDWRNQSFVKIGDSDLVDQGDNVIAIGNPQGLQNTISEGLISAIRSDEEFKIFQITCPISSGSSGGALFNTKSEVIGITSLILNSGQNINFAIPINELGLLQNNFPPMTFQEATKKERKEKLQQYKQNQLTSNQLETNDTLFDEVLELFNKAQKLSGTSYFELFGSKNIESIKLLEKAIEINPYYHAGQYLLGKSYFQLQKNEFAIKNFLTCIELKPKYSSQYNSIADVYKKIGEYAEALKYYDLALHNGEAPYWINLDIGDTYFEIGDISKAEHYYLEASKDKKNNFINSAEKKLAYLYLQKGDYKNFWANFKKLNYLSKEERSKFSKYLNRHGNYQYKILGKFNYLSEDYVNAKKNYESALKKNDIDVEQLYELGIIYYNEDNYLKAKKHLNQFFTKNPNHYDANLKLGIIYLYGDTYNNLKPNYLKAVSHFEKAKTINSKNSSPHYFLGKAYLMLKQYNTALFEAKEALSIEDDSMTHNLIGDIYYSKQNYDKALTSYKKALEKENKPYILEDVAKTYIALNQYKECEKILLENDIDNKSYYLYYYMGYAQEKLKKYKAALKSYQSYFEKYDSEDEEVIFRIGYNYSQIQDSETAIYWYEKLLNINPKNYNTLFNVALLYKTEKEYKKALESFKKSLAIKPNDPDTIRHINECEEILARKELPKKLLEISKSNNTNGNIAKLMIVLNDFNQANDIALVGVKETEPEYNNPSTKDYIVNYNVSSKIYEAQGRFEKLIIDIDSISTEDSNIQKVKTLFKSAIDLRVKGIDLNSKGYYIKKKDYTGEFEKGRAKTDLGNKYLCDGLTLLKDELGKRKSIFGTLPQKEVDRYIDYYKK